MKLVLAVVVLTASIPAQRVLFQHAEPGGTNLGWSVRRGGDVDGDGIQDFVVTSPEISGSPAEVRVVAGSSGMEIWRVANINQNGGLLDAVGFGDIDGDGRSDIGVAVYTELKVYSGASGTTMYSRPSPVGFYFVGISEIGDFDGDSRDDMAVAFYDGSGNAVVQIWKGSNGTPLATLQGVSNPRADGILRSVGDLDGDSLQDLALWTQQRVYVLSTSPPGTVLWTLTPTGAGSKLATTDLDGDGKREVIVGSSARLSTGHPGRVEVFDGSNGSSRLLIGLPFGSNGYFGFGMSGIGDLDQDGVNDLCLGTPTAEPSGEVLAFSGNTGERLWTFAGGAQPAFCGRSIADLGDVDGDGFHDVAVGCSGPYPASGWIVLSGKTLAEVTSKGGACGGGPFLPELGMTRPVLGRTATIACRDGAAGATGILALSPAPAFPTYLGASTCNVWFDLGAATMLHGTTRVQWSIRVPVPGVPQLAGVQVALQCFYAPTGGPLGVDLSNGLWARLGY